MPTAPHPDIFAPLPMIESALETALAHAKTTPRLKEAMAYATLGAGKRIRPLLAWHCCEALGGRGWDSLPACVAVEVVHCFSLVHDDLPALDNDELRRGKPTVHVRFGEAMAILAGDALLNLATQSVLAARWDVPDEVADTVRLTLARLLTDGTAAMVAGQVADSMHDFGPAMPDAQQRLTYIHANKTGALLEAACHMGAMSAVLSAKVDQEHVKAIGEYSRVVGVLFQAVDDLLDVTQTDEETGKKTNKDAEAGKLTFPSTYGVDGTRGLIAQFHEQSRAAVGMLGERGDALVAIADFIATRTR